MKCLKATLAVAWRRRLTGNELVESCFHFWVPFRAVKGVVASAVPFPEIAPSHTTVRILTPSPASKR